MKTYNLKDISKLKKWIVICAIILAAIIAVNSHLTLPKPFNSIVNIDYKVRTITLVNGIHKAPVAKIEVREDIDIILQALSEGKYSRKFNFVPRGGGGPIFKLVLEGAGPHNKTAINCYGKGLTINKKIYTTDPDVTWKIAAYLISKNLYQQAELGLVQIAHQNINNISKKYGEQNPYVAEIVPGITNKFGGTKVKYDVQLRGNFKKGTLQAENLYFSMQEIYPVFWDIKATNSNNKIIWKAVK